MFGFKQEQLSSEYSRKAGSEATYSQAFCRYEPMSSSKKNAESGSDVDDFGPSFVHKVSDYGCLTPVHEEVSLSIFLCSHSWI